MEIEKSRRTRFDTRTITLSSQKLKDTALNALECAPIDPLRPLLCVIMEAEEKRKAKQLKLMWVGPLRDIERQAWADGRQYSAEIWHEYFKREFLPDQYDESLCLKGYEKWGITPSGDRVLKAGTGDLTVRGFAQHLEQIHAAGANMGVMFSANPNQYEEF